MPNLENTAQEGNLTDELVKKHRKRKEITLNNMGQEHVAGMLETIPLLEGFWYSLGKHDLNMDFIERRGEIDLLIKQKEEERRGLIEQDPDAFLDSDKNRETARELASLYTLHLYLNVIIPEKIEELKLMPEDFEGIMEVELRRFQEERNKINTYLVQEQLNKDIVSLKGQINDKLSTIDKSDILPDELFPTPCTAPATNYNNLTTLREALYQGGAPGQEVILTTESLKNAFPQGARHLGILNQKIFMANAAQQLVAGESSPVQNSISSEERKIELKRIIDACLKLPKDCHSWVLSFAYNELGHEMENIGQKGNRRGSIIDILQQGNVSVENSSRTSLRRLSSIFRSDSDTTTNKQFLRRNNTTIV